jgi:hypothetical protein
LKKAVNIVLLLFYSFGTLCLPLGDFAFLPELPEMYRHCKATEDKDMTPLDFITDHLVNIDGIFDHHDNGDEQKPHVPVQSHHHSQASVSLVTGYVFSIAVFLPKAVKPMVPTVNFCRSDYISEIFRPPIVA